MFKRFKVLFIGCIIIIPFLFLSYSYARPPKPGPNFVWAKPYRAPNGILIHGHWKYVGSPQKGKAWVSRHYTTNGKWISGHWKSLPPKSGTKWIPGHRGPRGYWIQGHWR